MDRTTAIATWRAVCGSDMIMALPPTGRLLEEFARRIEAVEREACASVCESFGGNGEPYIDDDWARMCAGVIRARGTHHCRKLSN